MLSAPYLIFDTLLLPLCLPLSSPELYHSASWAPCLTCPLIYPVNAADLSACLAPARALVWRQALCAEMYGLF